MDSGHHLGAIAASAYIHNKNIQLIFDFDKLSLNADLGFENKEFICGCVISGAVVEKSVRHLRLSIPFVCGTDYFQRNEFIEDAYQATSMQPSHQQKFDYPQFKFHRERFLENVWNRRSIRRFQKKSISQDIYWRIWEDIHQPIPTENCEEIEIYAVVHRVDDLKPGIYKGRNLIQVGDFQEKTGYLCVNQALAKDCAVTLFFVSDYQNYQTAMQLAGFIGQRVYLFSNYSGIECSGIGAFYDHEAQEFLHTTKDVLYVMAIGK